MPERVITRSSILNDLECPRRDTPRTVSTNRHATMPHFVRCDWSIPFSFSFARDKRRGRGAASVSNHERAKRQHAFPQRASNRFRLRARDSTHVLENRSNIAWPSTLAPELICAHAFVASANIFSSFRCSSRSLPRVEWDERLR